MEKCVNASDRDKAGLHVSSVAQSVREPHDSGRRIKTARQTRHLSKRPPAHRILAKVDK